MLEEKFLDRRSFIQGGLGCATALWTKRILAEPIFGHIPFFVFDLSGGAALPGSFLVGKRDGPFDFLPSYSTLGWNPREPASIDTSFGLPLAVISGLRQGLYDSATSDSLANLRMGSFCHYAMDDTSHNPLSSRGVIDESGNHGDLFVHGIGATDSTSGGNSNGPRGLSDAPPRPAFIRNLDVLLDRGGDDPREDADLRRIFNIERATSVDDPTLIHAGMVQNTLNGNSGTCVITLAGYDYHDGTSLTGYRKDYEFGILLGRVLETASLYATPSFFQILTDGGCAARAGTRKWIVDSGHRSMSVIGLYDPAGAPSQHQLQVGQFTEDQTVDLTTAIGASPEKVPYAVLINYLTWIGARDRIADFVPRRIFQPSDYDSVTIFHPG